MSKNKSGIDNFFTNQKLFKPTNNKLTTNKISTSNISGRSTTKGYHYHLLNKSIDQIQKYQDIQKQQAQYQRLRKLQQVNVNNNDNKQQDRNYNTISHKAQQAQSRMVYSRNQQQKYDNKKQKSKQKQKKNYPYTTYRNQSGNDQGYQQPIQQQSPTGWQSLIIKSSRKYFDSCRSQANNYIQKLQKILGKDSNLIKTSLKKINNTIQQFYTQQCNKIKQNLYSLIDQILQKSKKNILQSFMQQQINYVAQLLQINTQIQQRYKQINVYKIQLDSEKDWKNCVSQLLINNYQDNLLHLSKLCKNSIDNVEKNVQQYCNKINKQILYKLHNKINQQDIASKIERIVNQQYFNKNNNKNAKQRIDTMKSAIRSSVTPIKNNSMGEVSTGNKYTTSGKKSQLGTFTNSNKWVYTDKYYGEGTNHKLNDQDNKQQAKFDKNYQQIQAKSATSGKYEQI